MCGIYCCTFLFCCYSRTIHWVTQVRDIFISHIDVDALWQSSCILLVSVVADFHTIAYHLCLWGSHNFTICFINYKTDSFGFQDSYAKMTGVNTLEDATSWWINLQTTALPGLTVRWREQFWRGHAIIRG